MKNSPHLPKHLKEQKPFLNYIHNFRGFAILAIVAHHVAASLIWNDSRQEQIVLTLIGNGSVYFVFIAGFLFQFLSPKYQYKDYLVKKIKYVIIPYVLVSIPAIVLIILGIYPSPGWFNERFSEVPTAGKAILYLLMGVHLSAFWFIPMIAIFYVISPIFIWLDQHPKFYWLLPALIGMTLLVPRPALNDNPFQAFAHFLSIYVAGMACSRFRQEFFSFMSRKYWLLIGIATALLASQIGIAGIPGTVNSLSKLILCLVVIHLLWRMEPYLPKTFNQGMGRLAELSFGIYFLHEYFIGYNLGIERKTGGFYALSQASFLNFLITFVLVLAGCMTVILAVKRIAGKNSRLIIGC